MYQKSSKAHNTVPQYFLSYEPNIETLRITTKNWNKKHDKQTVKTMKHTQTKKQTQIKKQTSYIHRQRKIH